MRVLLCCIPFFLWVGCWSSSIKTQWWPGVTVSWEYWLCLAPCTQVILTQEAPSSDYICVLGGHWGCFPPVIPTSSQGHWGAWLLQGCLHPDLAPVLSGALISCQRCILTVLSWRSVPYTTPMIFKNNSLVDWGGGVGLGWYFFGFVCVWFFFLRDYEVMELLMSCFSYKNVLCLF